MGRKVLVLVGVILISGCSCVYQPRERNNAEYGPMAIRLSEFSNQIIYYFQAKKQAIPSDFDEKQFVGILKQLPSDQINQKDVNAMTSEFVVKVHDVDSGYSVMLCDENGRKLMEDFASPRHSECRFELNRVEIQSWNENRPCSFEDNWRQFCLTP